MTSERLRELIQRGERKGRTHHLSAATYRRLGVPAAYVRRRGFEPIQQEQMILQYVQAHGRITRREAAELCRISSPQARDLLAKLVKKGVLVRQGRRRGIFYVKPSTIVDESKTEMDESTKSAQHPKNGGREP